MGRAWEVDITELKRTNPNSAAFLGTWLIEAPYANPLFNYYAPTLVHLRDIPGSPPVIYNRQGATHEFVMGTLNPDADDSVDPADFHSLMPMSADMQEQLILPSDERALEVVGLAIQACLDGRLPLGGRCGHWNEFFREQERL
ncbi:MAG TPA: hypothetical protein VF733_03210 [Candidatus Saccharimonadales bacterium]